MWHVIILISWLRRTQFYRNSRVNLYNICNSRISRSVEQSSIAVETITLIQYNKNAVNVWSVRLVQLNSLDSPTFNNYFDYKVKPGTMLKNKVEVLSSLRLLLKLTTLNNKNGVHFKYNKRGDSVKIPDFILLSLLSLLYYNSLLIWVKFEEKFDLKLISNSLAGAIGYVALVISYVSLAMKRNSVISIVDHLQEIVEKSK